MADITFTTKLAPNNNSAKLMFRNPKVKNSEPGHPICTLRDSGLTKVFSALKERALPHEDGPYADSNDETIGKMQWEMKKICRGDLELEIKWVIDVLLPRIIMSEGGSQFLEIPDSRGYLDLEFIFSSLGDSVRESNEIMTAGRLLAQPKVSIMNSDYSLTLFSEELIVLATALMRKSGREAYTTMLFGTDTIREGVAVFEKGDLLTFFLDRTHPPIFGIEVLSDPVVMSTLYIRNAEHRMRKELLIIDEGIEKDLIDGVFIDQTVRIVKGILAQGANYFSEHPEIPGSLQHFECARRDKKGLYYAFKLMRTIERFKQEIVAQKGIAKKKFLSSGNGMKQEIAEEKVKELIHLLKASFEYCGPDVKHLQTATMMLTSFVFEELLRAGLSPESANRLKSYAETTLNISDPGPIFTRLANAAEAEWKELKENAK